jgi:hypothetical protein
LAVLPLSRCHLCRWHNNHPRAKTGGSASSQYVTPEGATKAADLALQYIYRQHRGKDLALQLAAHGGDDPESRKLQGQLLELDVEAAKLKLHAESQKLESIRTRMRLDSEYFSSKQREEQKQRQLKVELLEIEYQRAKLRLKLYEQQTTAKTSKAWSKELKLTKPVVPLDIRTATEWNEQLRRLPTVVPDIRLGTEWNEFGVTPAPVSPLTANVLEWMGLRLSPITKQGFREKNVLAKYPGGLDVTFVRTHGPAAPI